MKIKEGMEQEYEEKVRVNSADGYGAGIIRYIQRWAGYNIVSHITKL